MAFTGGAGSVSEAAEKSHMTSTEENALSTVLTMTDAFQRGDMQTLMACYEEGAAVVFEPGAPIADAATLREQFAAASALKPRFDYSGHETYVAGDIALHIAPWTMRATAPDGSTIEQRGLSVAVLRRQADGKWLLLIDNPFGQRLLEEQEKMRIQ